MDKLEEKLNLENEINSKKRDLKLTLTHLDAIKSEYAGTVALVEKNKALIDEQGHFLQKTLNDISFERLQWATEKAQKEQELSEKESAAQNVLNRKAELNEQEEEMRKIEKETTDKRNEYRGLELKVDAEKNALLIIAMQIEDDKKDIVKKEAQLEQNKEEFKGKVRLLIDELTKI